MKNKLQWSLHGQEVDQGLRTQIQGTHLLVIVEANGRIITKQCIVKRYNPSQVVGLFLVEKKLFCLRIYCQKKLVSTEPWLMGNRRLFWLFNNHSHHSITVFLPSLFMFLNHLCERHVAHCIPTNKYKISVYLQTPKLKIKNNQHIDE